MFGLSINYVVGQNISPQLHPGSYVLFHRFFQRKKLKVGELIKVKHPKLGVLVRTIAHIDSNGLFWLQGSTYTGDMTTLEMGPIRPKHIIGRPLFIYRAHKPQLNNPSSV